MWNVLSFINIRLFFLALFGLGLSACEITVNNNSGDSASEGASNDSDDSDESAEEEAEAVYDFPVIDTNSIDVPTVSGGVGSSGSDAGSDGLVLSDDGVALLELAGDADDSLGLNDFESTGDIEYLPNARGTSTAAYFDGVDDWVYYDINRGHVFRPYGAYFAISFWFSTTQSGTQYILEERFQYTTGAMPIRDFIDIRLENGTLIARYNTDWAGGSSEVSLSSTTTDLNDGNWHHVVFVRTGARTGDLYINNVREAQDVDNSGSAGGVSPINSDLVIGRNLDGTSFFNGFIDDVYFSMGMATPMSASDVNSLFNR